MAHSWQFVKAPSATPTVELDLDNLAPLSIQEGTSVSPPKLRRATTASLDDGDIETRSAYMDRVIVLPLKIKDGTASESQAGTMQQLARILDRREGAWLMWQSEGQSQPVFFRTKRADYDVVDSVLDATPKRALKLEIAAEPFVYGLPVTTQVTITNDPTSGTNKMAYKMPAIQGDVMTPLVVGFPTPDAAHRIVLASNSLVQGPPLVSIADVFSRPDGSSLGTTGFGAAPWTAERGTWGIASMQGRLVTGVASDWTAATVDAGYADGTVEVLIRTASSDGFLGLKLRGGATYNTGFAVFSNRMWDIAQASSAIGGVFSQTFVSGDRMRVVTSGQTITVYRQAGGVGPWTQVMTTTSALYATNTKFGLAASGTTNAQAGRVDEFSIKPAAASLPSAPYWRPFVAEQINTSPTDWTFSDVADANSVAGTVRRLDRTADTGGPLEVRPALAALSQWPGPPPGQYRPFLRVQGDSGGADLYELENGTARPAGTARGADSVRDWLPLGEMSIAMPAGAPPISLEYDSGAPTPPAPWGMTVTGAVDVDDDPILGQTDLDGVLLIPTARPGLISRFLTLKFSSTYLGKYVTVDGINNDDVVALGHTAATPTVDQYVYPDEQAGGTPVVVPGADNLIIFMATVADTFVAAGSRAADSKSTTTVLTLTYLPRYLSAERPAAS